MNFPNKTNETSEQFLSLYESPPPPPQMEIYFNIYFKFIYLCLGMPPVTRGSIQERLVTPFCSQLWLLNIFEMTYILKEYNLVHAVTCCWVFSRPWFLAVPGLTITWWDLILVLSLGEFWTFHLISQSLSFWIYKMMVASISWDCCCNHINKKSWPKASLVEATVYKVSCVLCFWSL